MKIIECPRDAMQGIEKFIPTETKVHYINKLLKIGFDTIDFGSFVSEKAVPQMRDTSKVIDALDLNETKSKLLAIIANSRGANKACEYNKIEYLGYPLSISNEFQLRNTGMTCVEALKEVSRIKEIAEKKDKNLVVKLIASISLPIGILILMTMMVIPLPVFLLDVFFTSNILISLIVVRTSSIYIKITS